MTPGEPVLWLPGRKTEACSQWVGRGGKNAQKHGESAVATVFQALVLSVICVNWLSLILNSYLERPLLERQNSRPGLATSVALLGPQSPCYVSCDPSQ